MVKGEKREDLREKDVHEEEGRDIRQGEKEQMYKKNQGEKRERQRGNRMDRKREKEKRKRIVYEKRD